MKRYTAAIVIVALAAGALIAQAVSKTFYVNDERHRDVVTFTSKAPMETIVGATGHVIGFVETDLADITKTKARFQVDLATLRTGIDKRDRDMREKFLETDKHPHAIFELTRVAKASQPALENQKAVEIEAEGDFTVHGVTRKITVPLKITYFQESEDTKVRLPGDIVRIEGTWDILLSDYKISRPQFLILKLDDKQKIDIDVFASTGSPAVDFAMTGQAQ